MAYVRVVGLQEDGLEADLRVRLPGEQAPGTRGQLREYTRMPHTLGAMVVGQIPMLPKRKKNTQKLGTAVHSDLFLWCTQHQEVAVLRVVRLLVSLAIAYRPVDGDIDKLGEVALGPVGTTRGAA